MPHNFGAKKKKYEETAINARGLSNITIFLSSSRSALFHKCEQNFRRSNNDAHNVYKYADDEKYRILDMEIRKT